jgi:hypothetical protein
LKIIQMLFSSAKYRVPSLVPPILVLQTLKNFHHLPGFFSHHIRLASSSASTEFVSRAASITAQFTSVYSLLNQTSIANWRCGGLGVDDTFFLSIRTKGEDPR